MIFLVGFFITQCSKQNYTNSLSSIETVTAYKEIDKSVLESSGQTTKTLNTINSNNDAIRTYLNKDVKSQFDNVSNNISALNSQIANLYTILNNSLMIMSIVLGLFTLIIAVFGFYISNIITARYKEIKESEDKVRELEKNIVRIDEGVERTYTNANKIITIVEDATVLITKLVKEGAEIKNDVEEHNKAIQNALKGHADELYKRFREEHIKSIIALLKENFEDIEFYHSELITSLRYLKFEDIKECLDAYYKSTKIAADSNISSKYLHILLLLDTDKCLNDLEIFKRIIKGNYIALPKLQFTYAQMKNILNGLINCKLLDIDISERASFIKNLIQKDKYSKFESCLRSIDRVDEKEKFIQELLKLDRDVFDSYIKQWKSFYEKDKRLNNDCLKDIALMEKFKQELSQPS